MIHFSSLFRPRLPPVISVDGQDPLMVKAVREVRRRWPEFVAAFQANRSDDNPFIVKMEFNEHDKVEFMWVSVIRSDGDTIHGDLENHPHELTAVKKGQNVSVPVSALNDWVFIKEEESVGGFTLKVVGDAEKRK